MPTILVTDSKTIQTEVEFQEGDTLMEVLRDHGYQEIAAICGGSCSCATCHVWVNASPSPLPEIEGDEEVLLELADGYDPVKSRLSCQIELSDEFQGLDVSLIAED